MAIGVATEALSSTAPERISAGGGTVPMAGGNGGNWIGSFPIPFEPEADELEEGPAGADPFPESAVFATHFRLGAWLT